MAPHIILLTFPEGSKSVSKKVTVAEDMTMGELSKIAQSMLARNYSDGLTRELTVSMTVVSHRATRHPSTTKEKALQFESDTPAQAQTPDRSVVRCCVERESIVID